MERRSKDNNNAASLFKVFMRGMNWLAVSVSDSIARRQWKVAPPPVSLPFRRRRVGAAARGGGSRWFGPRGRFAPPEDLLVGQEPGAQLLVFHLLDTHFVIDRQTRRRRRRLPQDHKDGLHPNGTIGNVRSREAHGHEQVLALA